MNIKFTQRKISLPYYRDITYWYSKEAGVLYYSQGNTCIRIQSDEDKDLWQFYNKNIPFIYKVMKIADFHKNGVYRKGRRHYEIIHFIETVYLTAYPDVKQKYIRPVLTVTSMDGSTRTALVNGLSFAKLIDNRLATSSRYRASAISFGKNQNGELVYDLNYEEDSTGYGDCAIAGYSILSTNIVSPTREKIDNIRKNFDHPVTDFEQGSQTYVVSIMYEGNLSINEFLTGLHNSIVGMWIHSNETQRYAAEN